MSRFFMIALLGLMTCLPAEGAYRHHHHRHHHAAARTARRVGVGAAGGAVIGALAGGGKGAAIGAIAGAGAGAVYDHHERRVGK